MKIIIALLAITILINIFLSLLVIRSSKTQHDKLYVLINTSIALWALGDLIMLFSNSETVSYIGALVFYIAPITTPVALFLFSEAFPYGIRNKLVYYVSLSCVAVASFLVFVGRHSFIKEVVFGQPINTIVPNRNYFIIYSIFLGIFFVLTYLSFIKRIYHTDGAVRIQLWYAFIGVFVSSNIAMATNIFLPIQGNYSLVWVGPPATIFAAMMIALAIIKYKLFEVKSTVARTLTYSSFVILIALTYVITVSLISTYVFRRNSISNIDLAINALAALIVAFTFGPLKAKFDKYTNSIFFRDAYDPQEFLNQLNAKLVSGERINGLLRDSANIITNHLKPSFTGISANDQEEGFRHVHNTKGLGLNNIETKHVINYMQQTKRRSIVVQELESQNEVANILIKHQVGLLTELVTNGELIGLLILGDRKSGLNYRNRDVQLLETAADSIAIAVQSALRFEEIEDLNINLQKKIEIATHDLQKSNEKLKALDEAKDEFISMASHQLRTPLTSVKGYISMVLEGDTGPLKPQQRVFLDQAFMSSQRMVYLIADLLNVSRLKTGKFIIDSKPTYLPDIIESEVNQLIGTAESRGLKLVFNKPASFPMLNLDEVKIRQVVMNFTDNAIYYTPKGGKITVALVATKDTITLTVKDTGIGIPKHEQQHLFSKFYRASNAKKARPDGTGLGLYMGKKVIIAQGGAVIFKAEPGNGSTFGFSFPRAKLEIPTEYN